jgi:hypothetical protein
VWLWLVYSILDRICFVLFCDDDTRVPYKELGCFGRFAAITAMTAPMLMLTCHDHGAMPRQAALVLVI